MFIVKFMYVILKMADDNVLEAIIIARKAVKRNPVFRFPVIHSESGFNFEIRIFMLAPTNYRRHGNSSAAVIGQSS